MEELGRRAVACKGWRWMPGMRLVAHGRQDSGLEFSRVAAVDTKHVDIPDSFIAELESMLRSVVPGDFRIGKPAEFSWTVHTSSESRVVDDDGESWCGQSQRHVPRFDPPLMDSLEPFPDVADPGTLGCLLRLVREAHGRPGAWCEPDGGDLSRWAVYADGRGRIAYGESEAEALVCALEVAP